MTDAQRPKSAFAIWLWAARPRTLPLAVSAIVLGYGYAFMQGHARFGVFLLAFVTALLLQILSNLANDYGDAVSGKDTAERLGPLRMVASGLASPDGMFRAMVLASLLAVASGTALVLLALWGDWPRLLLFLVLGAASIAAAIMYTVGKRPYGYVGLGDFMAGFFFGPVAVWGSAILCGATPSPPLLLPGLAAGLCSTMVLNVNNMRDIDTDRRTGKMTIAARLGIAHAAVYHTVLGMLTAILWIAFWLWVNPAYIPGIVLALPLARSVYLAATRATDPDCLNMQLRYTVLGSALLNTGMGILCMVN